MLWSSSNSLSLSLQLSVGGLLLRLKSFRLKFRFTLDSTFFRECGTWNLFTHSPQTRTRCGINASFQCAFKCTTSWRVKIKFPSNKKCIIQVLLIWINWIIRIYSSWLHKTRLFQRTSSSEIEVRDVESAMSTTLSRSKGFGFGQSLKTRPISPKFIQAHVLRRLLISSADNHFLALFHES